MDPRRAWAALALALTVYVTSRTPAPEPPLEADAAAADCLAEQDRWTLGQPMRLARATDADLDALPRVGPATAARLRRAHAEGARSWEDLAGRARLSRPTRAAVRPHLDLGPAPRCHPPPR